ncbi:MAG: ribosome maturation factor RimP [Spirochaetales bacterium]|nr:ribosome maturation factor RimP [Spirochaetales bacterium]
MTLKDVEEQEILPLFEKMGYSLVELSQSNSRGSLTLHIVIYREEGVSIDDCTQVHRALAPRLEVVLAPADLYIEVSSPGLNRKFKSEREYAAFKGRAVKILRDDQSEWDRGVIAGADDNSVTLVLPEGDEMKIAFSKIKKGKFDYERESRK